jgi:hypothetical protein
VLPIRGGSRLELGVLALVGDVAQLGAEHRVGQSAGGLDALRRRRRLGAQGGEFGMAAAGEFEQALDLAADHLSGGLGMSGRRRDRQHRRQPHKMEGHGPTSRLRC